MTLILFMLFITETRFLPYEFSNFGISGLFKVVRSKSIPISNNACIVVSDSLSAPPQGLKSPCMTFAFISDSYPSKAKPCRYLFHTYFLFLHRFEVFRVGIIKVGYEIAISNQMNSEPILFTVSSTVNSEQPV